MRELQQSLKDAKELRTKNCLTVLFFSFLAFAVLTDDVIAVIDMSLSVSVIAWFYYSCKVYRIQKVINLGK